ncbi:MAG TPA: GrpB family protein [Anaerolineales bacterium]|nr:GrpB family protein [Anaerolineales bacterium]
MNETPKSSTQASVAAPMTDEQILASNLKMPAVLNQSVLIVNYDPEWPRLFEREETRIRDALSTHALSIEHVGSTSVPGLAAKPKIDILLVVASSADESSYVPSLENAGYTLQIREPDWYEHRMFRGPDTDVNLHVFSQGCEEIEKMLLFRNWLRNNLDDRQLYEQTKRDLAKQTWKYMQNYADAKSAVVAEIMGRAKKAVKPNEAES